jgi:hypothetical protein
VTGRISSPHAVFWMTNLNPSSVRLPALIVSVCFSCLRASRAFAIDPLTSLTLLRDRCPVNCGYSNFRKSVAAERICSIYWKRIEREGAMATCEVCGNEYDKAFELIAAGARHTFDSFECAIQAIAPICEHCKCRVIGHGVEVGGRFFCCAHCARSATSADVRDRAA